MQERHRNRKLYFDEQSYTTEKYVIPFIEQWGGVSVGAVGSDTGMVGCNTGTDGGSDTGSVGSDTGTVGCNTGLVGRDTRTDGGKPLDMRVLEIGCGEGGNLKPFLDRGCVCTGVDLNGPQIERAKEFFAGHPHEDQLTLLHADIYDVSPDENQYDIIMLRDVIEHIHNQERLMHILPRFLKPHGVMFFAFPPWMMPFGGHQQICRSRLSKVPYIHLLPRRWYGRLLHRFGESDKCIEELQEIKETGITIERWERILHTEQLPILRRELYFINPNYEVKFGLRPRRSLPVFRRIPYLRDYYVTAAYYLIGG